MLRRFIIGIILIIFSLFSISLGANLDIRYKKYDFYTNEKLLETTENNSSISTKKDLTIAQTYIKNTASHEYSWRGAYGLFGIVGGAALLNSAINNSNDKTLQGLPGVAAGLFGLYSIKFGIDNFKEEGPDVVRYKKMQEISDENEKEDFAITELKKDLIGDKTQRTIIGSISLLIGTGFLTSGQTNSKEAGILFSAVGLYFIFIHRYDSEIAADKIGL